jgi:pyrroloquinoline quinone biosynthesis protein B
MRLRILGAAAGGGLPQWNCACENCGLARQAGSALAPATQDSVAVWGEGPDAVLLNASPDIHAQLARTPALQPQRARHTPIAAIVLTNGDLDHVLGLFSLRESQPLTVFATDAVRAGLVEGNALLRTLKRFEGQLTWRRLVLDEEVPLAGGLTVRAVGSPGKLPVHLAGARAPSPEDNVGLVLRHGATAVAYLAAAADLTPGIERAVAESQAVLFDGTFWSSDELIRLGLGTARAEDMAHLPVGGPGGSLARLRAPGAQRRLFTHVNNTNPVWRKDSPERAQVERAGWEIAHDGLEFEV